ncbi:transposase [Streptomyces sp. NPDC055036]
MLQFLLDLSDWQAVEAVRCRIDFTYPPTMELDNPGFHHSVLADFRERLAQGDRADRPLDLALTRLKDAGLVRELTTQRTDSTHVLAAVREVLSRWRRSWSARWRRSRRTPLIGRVHRWAERSGLSRSTVGRIWRRFQLKPHRVLTLDPGHTRHWILRI